MINLEIYRQDEIIKSKSYEALDDIRISSRDVAVMLEMKEHSKMLKKIDSLSKSLAKANIDLSQYWIQSSYRDSSGKENREFAVSKKGCELIAHKTTGDKGVTFTVKYMERFEMMEKALLEINPPSYMIENPIDRAKRWIAEQEEKLLLEEDNKLKDKKIQELKPRAEYADSVLSSPNLITSTDIAKDLGISSISLHKILNELGVIFRRDNKDKTWKFYCKYQHMVPEYADYHISRNSQRLKWTEKGRQFIINLITNNKEGCKLLNKYRNIYNKKNREEYIPGISANA